MNKSYKVALLVVVVVCAGILGWYAMQSDSPESASSPSGEGQAAQSQADLTPSASPSRPGSSVAGASRSRGSSSNSDMPPLPPLPERRTEASPSDTPSSPSSSDLLAKLRAQVAAANRAAGSALAEESSAPAPGSAPGSAPGNTPGSGAAVAGGPQAAEAAASAGQHQPGAGLSASAAGNEPMTTTIPVGEQVAARNLGSGTLSGTQSAGVAGTASSMQAAAAPSTQPTSASPAGAPRAASATAMNPPASRPPAARPAAASTYTIQAGDTFSSIAQKLYGSERRWVDIAQANPTVDPARLRVGQVIRLPGTTVAGASAASAQPAAQTPRLASAASAGQGRSYTVQPRDTLSSIARRFYGDSSKWHIIYEANRARIGSNPDRMPAGVTLVIPPASRASQ